MQDRKLLASLARPSRYLGQEFNSVTRPWQENDLNVALLFPDLYEIGMSHQGLQLLYHLLNGCDGVRAERCYTPAPDAEALLRNHHQPLTTLESSRPLTDFDLVGITLPYELCYSNILTMLDLAHLPFYARERSDGPLLIAGGACALNPEPVAEFFDAVLLGDGEEAILEIAELLRTNKGASHAEKIALLEQVEGVYLPSRYQPKMEGDRLVAVERLDGNPDRARVRRRIVADMNTTAHLTHPLVPNAKTVHDRFVIEVARGCTRGCRFCQAGMTYRPVRERTPEQILQLATEGIGNSGFEELALLSLSTGDYSCLDQTLAPLMDTFAQRYVSVAMPSMRVGTLTPAVMEQIKRVRKTGFTLAPEAGSERLRNVINKGITEADLLETSRDAFRLGWSLIKCYFMIGLPTETDDDIAAMAELVKKVIHAGREGQAETGGQKKRPQVNVSVGTFVPKPHTPFQWQEQVDIDESFRRIRHLEECLPRKGGNLKYHNPKVSWLEGVFSRGDRRLAPLLVEAWKRGARLDGWAEHFKLGIWTDAAEALGLNLAEYLRQRDLEEVLPWSHLDCGVSDQFLKDEWQRALAESYTPDCRYHACQNCGVCDFKTIRPIVHNRDHSLPPAVSHPAPAPVPADQQLHVKYMVHYSRRGQISFLGHLEILQLLFRTLQRAEIPVHFSQGFNPSPKVSFGPALPVGTDSRAEFFIMDLKEPIADLTATAARLNATLPPGLAVHEIELHSGRMPQKMRLDYRLILPAAWRDKVGPAVDKFLAAESFSVTQERKKKMRTIDLRPQVVALTVDSDGERPRLYLSMVSEAAIAGVKPAEATAAILGLSNEEMTELHILKEGWRPLP